MPKKTVKRPTICWKCRNAVPTATSGCSWSRDLVPVPGWVAEKHTTPHANDGGMITSYCVDYCPEFQKDSKAPEQICKNDEACMLRAACNELRQKAGLPKLEEMQ